MAKIQFGMMMTDARGKLGGHVFSKSRSGNYVRTKGIPINQNTPAQSVARSSFGLISKSWSGLTEQQIDAWNAAVINFQKTDIFGNLRSPSGKNLFSALNLNARNIGNPNLIVDPPADASQGGFAVSGTTEFDLATPELQAELQIVLVAGGLPANYRIVVEATPPLSAGTNFAKDKYRQIGIYTPDTATVAAIEMYDDYVAKFGEVLTGKNYFFRYKLVQSGTGIASSWLEIKAVFN